jgi:uncharacterized protein YjiS (DUF1127 family)
MFLLLILSKIHAWLRYRETVAELSRLTDRDLEDLGVSRFEIKSLARTSARTEAALLSKQTPAPRRALFVVGEAVGSSSSPRVRRAARPA